MMTSTNASLKVLKKFNDKVTWLTVQLCRESQGCCLCEWLRKKLGWRDAAIKKMKSIFVTSTKYMGHSPLKSSQDFITLVFPLAPTMHSQCGWLTLSC